MKASDERTPEAVAVAPPPPRTEQEAPEASRRVPYTPPSVPTPPATRRLEPALFGALMLTSDTIALAGGLLFVWWLRFSSGLLPTPLGVPPLSSYAMALPVVVALGLFVLQRGGLYRAHRASSFFHDLADGGRQLALLTVLLAAGAFFYRGFSFSRTVLIGYAAVSLILLVGGRRFVAIGHRALRRRGIGVQRVAIAGDGQLGRRIEERLARCDGNGMVVVAHLRGDEWRGADGHDAFSERALLPVRVRSFVRRNKVDRLIVADPDLSHDDRLDLVEACHGAGVRCDFGSDLYEVMMGRLHLEEIGGIPLVGARLHPLDRADRFKKRALDLVVSGVGLLLISPLLALVALVVRVDSPGPILFRQPRLGRDGREFDILKFRSMPVEAETGSGPRRATREDGRATRVGRVLRRTSLDELPQLWNVLRGQMSLVGPRPERRYFVDRFERSIPRYLERHRVKSGITGWAQVNGLRGDTSIEERTRYDIWYVENWSVRLDVRILVLTLGRFLFQDEAY